MINTLAVKIADFLLCQKSISADEEEVYVYGIKLIISDGINLLLCVIISLIMGELLNGLIYYLAFASLRRFTGGFHCQTFLRCNTVFSFIIFLGLLTDKLFVNRELYVVLCFMILFSLVIIAKYAPIENINKRILPSDSIKFKALSLLVFMIHIALYTICVLVFNYCLNIIVICDFIVAMMMIIELLRKRSEKNEND